MIEDIIERERMELEHEQLHKRIVQTERLITIGRLTSSLSHEINNAMQAIQGALNLALERVDDPSELATFLHMGLEESQKVAQLLTRLHYTYPAKVEDWELLDLNHLLQETITLGRRQLKQQKVTLQTDLAPDLPPLAGLGNQLYLVFLSLLLNLADAIGVAGGGELQLRSYAWPQGIRVEFSTKVPIASEPHVSELDTWQKELTVNLGLSFSQDVILTHGGTVDLSRQNGEVICRIELPLSKPDSPKVV